LNKMKKISIKKIISALFLLAIFVFIGLAGQTAEAQNLKDAFKLSDTVASESGYNETDLNTVIGNIIMTVLSLIGAVAIIFIIYAGALWMTAGGNEQKAEKAKTILKQSIIGVIVILCAYAITYFVINIFQSQVSIL